MNIVKGMLRESPYLGVFGFATEDVVLLPNTASGEEVKLVGDSLGSEILEVSVASSPLLGVFVAGVGKKIIAPEIASKEEIAELESKGLEVKVLNGITALGNLVAMNSKGGFVSELIDEKKVEELESFFGIKFFQKPIAGGALPGASIVVTEKGFVADPNTTAEEFKEMEKVFGVKGSMSTANYGDRFVGNDIIANSGAAVVGAQTSGHELIRIDEGLRGD